MQILEKMIHTTIKYNLDTETDPTSRSKHFLLCSGLSHRQSENYINTKL